MNSTCFDDVISVSKLSPGKYEARIATTWNSQLGPNGGYIAAILVNSLMLEIADKALDLVGINVRFMAPVQPGAGIVEIDVEKMGRSIANLSVRLVQRARITATASATCSKSRTGPAGICRPMPMVQKPIDLPSKNIMSETMLGYMPFRDHFDLVFAIGPVPPEKSNRALSGGWVRLKERRGLDETLVAAIADAWIPSLYVTEIMIASAPTLEMSIHLFGRKCWNSLPDSFVLVQVETIFLQSGFLIEEGWIWSETGEAIAATRQLAVAQTQPSS